jgi:hypothetical protein
MKATIASISGSESMRCVVEVVRKAGIEVFLRPRRMVSIR